jgi:N-acetylmuramoyl-L-alanine amidase
MRFPRTLAFAALAASPVLSLTSCGGDAEGARTTLGTVQTTSYVVEEPVTTTTTSTLPTTPIEGQISPTEQIHVVVAGDSLSRIASTYGITLDALINYNAWTDGINHVILPGAEVKIPPQSRVPSATPDTGAGDTGGGDTGGGDTGAGGETPTETTAAAGEGCTHVIESGDNPTRVANQYAITVDELAAANAGNPAYQNFLIGSSLSIPANGTC